MTSSPLFMRVDESMVILGPIAQVGWASAWAGVTPSRSLIVRPRNGPPDPVSSTSSSAPDALGVSRSPARHW